jgi:hypothetical protein
MESGSGAIKAREVCETILKLEISDHAKEFAQFLQIAVDGKSPEELEELVAPFVRERRMKIMFLESVLEDVAEGRVTTEDIAELSGPLKVVAEVKELRERLTVDIAALENRVSDSQVAATVNRYHHDQRLDEWP